MKVSSGRITRLARPLRSKNRGFALVVTLSLMILLTILAVGLLSLSSVSLRNSSQGAAMAEARANARLAMMIALGDLQKHAGPDKRITAPAGTLGTDADVSRHQVTGVWESIKQGAGSAPADFTKQKKLSAQVFKRWLVSDPSSRDLSDSGLVRNSLPTSATTVELVSGKSSAQPPIPGFNAKKVDVTNVGGTNPRPRGRYAYAVFEEATKARVNLGEESSTATDLGLAAGRLGAGQRPAVERLPKFEAPSGSLDSDKIEGKNNLSKMVSLPSVGLALADRKSPSDMRDKFYDLTTSSTGLLVNVVEGGFKKDFNLLAQNSSSLPAEFKGKPIYNQGALWDRAFKFANVFNERNQTTSTRTGPIINKLTASGSGPATGSGAAGLPAITASSPPGWTAGTGRLGTGSRGGTATVSTTEANGPVLLPSIAKIQMSFALAARDVYRYTKDENPLSEWKEGEGKSLLHGVWGRRFQTDVASRTVFQNDINLLLHLVYSPIVTLHNPYNLPITFNKLRVEFVNLPFAFQVFKNGLAQTKLPVPFSLMYTDFQSGGETKRFGVTLSSSKSADRAVTMLPGEVLVFTPNINPSRTWKKEVEEPGAPDGFWDWTNASTEDGRSGGTADSSNRRGIPGWNGPEVGYDLDFLVPFTNSRYKNDGANTENVGGGTIDRSGGIPLRGGPKVTNPDQIHVEFSPLADPALAEKKFSVEMTIDWRDKKTERVSVLEFDLGGETGLRDALLEDHPQAIKATGRNEQVIRWPKSGTVSANDLYDHSSTSLADNSGTRGFALFSIAAKNAAGGKKGSDSTRLDEGQWKAKPFSLQNHSAPVSQNKLQGSHLSYFSHEVSLVRYEPSLIEIETSTQRGNFLTANTAQEGGRRFGVLYEVPLAPLQHFSQLNGALLGAGRRQPHFSAPVGNSYAHSLIKPDQVEQDSNVDHSFMLNASLFDHFYFSGFQSDAPKTLAGGDKEAAKLIDDFVKSGQPGVISPLTDKRLRMYLPSGDEPATVASLLKDPATGYSLAASYQLMEGAFNVNSISKDAWIAMLSSMSGARAQALVTPPNETSSSTAETSSSTAKFAVTKTPVGTNEHTDGARFSRTRIPNGISSGKTISPDDFWRSPIDLSASDLDSLATQIVAQVKERGPFLSLSEFVNRQIGGNFSSKGALQAAIDATNINSRRVGEARVGDPIAASDVSTYKLQNVEAMAGHSAEGAPGFLMQQDILAVLGNAATVRSDTFTIRAYGEALDATGTNVLATAYCEAVVQRLPDYVDSAERATVSPAVLRSNLDFGRRFHIVSFRWISKNEI